MPLFQALVLLSSLPFRYHYNQRRCLAAPFSFTRCASSLYAFSLSCNAACRARLSPRSSSSRLLPLLSQVSGVIYFDSAAPTSITSTNLLGHIVSFASSSMLRRPNVPYHSSSETIAALHLCDNDLPKHTAKFAHSG